MTHGLEQSFSLDGDRRALRLLCSSRSLHSTIKTSTMDRQLIPPLRLEPVSAATPLPPAKAHTALSHYLTTLPAGTSRTQLERLVDSLGVDLGLIAPDESQRREEQRRIAKAERKAEKKRQREEQERGDLEAVVEGLGGEMEEGAVGFEGEPEMDDKGDVEYGDDESDDEDEPDNQKMDVDMDGMSSLNIANHSLIHNTWSSPFCTHIQYPEETAPLHLTGVSWRLALPKEHHVVVDYSGLGLPRTKLGPGLCFLIRAQ